MMILSSTVTAVIWMGAQASETGAGADGWKKVVALESGQEVRVVKRGDPVGKTVVGVFDEANEDRLVMVVNKKEQVAVAREEVERVEARPKGNGPRVTKTSKTTQNMPMDRPGPAANPGERMRPVPPGSTSEVSSGLSVGGKAGYELVYRRRAGGPAAVTR